MNGANYAAQIERLGRLTRYSRELKNLDFGGYSRRVNQSGACSSSNVLRAEAENPKQQWRTNLLWLYVGTRSCTILLHTFAKTGINLATSRQRRSWSANVMQSLAPTLKKTSPACIPSNSEDHD